MTAALFPLHVPLRPGYTLGFDHLIHLPASNGFDGVLIVIDHLTRMAML
jgi:hypothetical protein